MSWVLATDDGHCPTDVADEHEGAGISAPPEGCYVDDITGQDLPPDLVRTGRLEELSGFHSKPAYDIMPRAEAKRRGIKILGTRWVDKLKGAEVRSRLCAEDFNLGKRANNADLFAPTTLLVAARSVASRTASCGWGRRTRRRLMSLDFKKAFLNAFR